jgi:glucose-1-phosphate thymidylyltransferase
MMGLKGVILAGGTGTRLYPLTHLVNKHLLPVGKKPMLEYAIEKFREAGIRELIAVIGKQSAQQYVDYFASGEKWGVHLAFLVQERAGGIAQAVSLVEPFIPRGEKFAVLLGDNLFEDSLRGEAETFARQPGGARVLLKKVPDPRRYGVPVIEGNRIRDIEEKPECPKSDYCVTGIYFYDTGVFDKIRAISPSARGELEISDVNALYAREGKLTYGILQGWWTDAGTFASLREAAERMEREDGKEGGETP